MVIRGPFVHRNFDNHLGLGPDDASHHLRVHLVNTARFGQIAEGTSWSYEFFDRRMDFSASRRHETIVQCLNVLELLTVKAAHHQLIDPIWTGDIATDNEFVALLEL